MTEFLAPVLQMFDRDKNRAISMEAHRIQRIADINSQLMQLSIEMDVLVSERQRLETILGRGATKRSEL